MRPLCPQFLDHWGWCLGMSTLPLCDSPCAAPGLVLDRLEGSGGGGGDVFVNAQPVSPKTTWCSSPARLMCRVISYGRSRRFSSFLNHLRVVSSALSVLADCPCCGRAFSAKFREGGGREGGEGEGTQSDRLVTWRNGLAEPKREQYRLTMQRSVLQEGPSQGQSNSRVLGPGCVLESS